MIFLVQFKYIKFLILPIGFFMFVACDAIVAYTVKYSQHRIAFNGFLICVAAGYITGKYSGVYRNKFIVYLKDFSLLVFVPFFTQVGASVNAPALISTIGFSTSAAAVRLASLAIGTYVGGSLCGMDIHMKKSLWVGLVPQSGVSLTLVGIVGKLFNESFGSYFHATVTGMILVNQILGPVGVRYLIQTTKEDGKANLAEANQHPWLDNAEDDPVLMFDGATQWDIDDCKLVNVNAFSSITSCDQHGQEYRLLSVSCRWEGDKASVHDGESKPGSEIDCAPSSISNFSHEHNVGRFSLWSPSYSADGSFYSGVTVTPNHTPRSLYKLVQGVDHVIRNVVEMVENRAARSLYTSPHLTTTGASTTAAAVGANSNYYFEADKEGQSSVSSGGVLRSRVKRVKMRSTTHPTVTLGGQDEMLNGSRSSTNASLLALTPRSIGLRILTPSKYTQNMQERNKLDDDDDDDDDNDDNDDTNVNTNALSLDVNNTNESVVHNIENVNSNSNSNRASMISPTPSLSDRTQFSITFNGRTSLGPALSDV